MTRTTTKEGVRMLERVRRHPLPSLFLVGCVTCIGVYAYTGYTNLNEIYKTLGFKAESNHLNFILASYIFMTVTFLALLIGGRLAEWLSDREIGMKSLLKFSWKMGDCYWAFTYLCISTSFYRLRILSYT